VTRMNSDEAWARCAECGTELEQAEKICPKCRSTRKAFDKRAFLVLGLKLLETRVRQRREGFKKFMKEMISRWRPSRSPDLKDGVNEQRIIDKDKGRYCQIVRDARTGEIIHEEDEPLSQHRPLGRGD